MSRTITIRLLKKEIDYDIDARSYKRNDATPELANERESAERISNAVSSDSSEDLDGSLIMRYRDLRDARLRKALKFCLKKPEVDQYEFTNVPVYDKEYTYVLEVPDEMTVDDIRGMCTKMHEYIVRGTLHDWYTYLSMKPTDDELTLGDLEDEIAGEFRGHSWVNRPLQPFGPAEYIKSY